MNLVNLKKNFSRDEACIVHTQIFMFIFILGLLCNVSHHYLYNESTNIICDIVIRHNSFEIWKEVFYFHLFIFSFIVTCPEHFNMANIQYMYGYDLSCILYSPIDHCI